MGREPRQHSEREGERELLSGRDSHSTLVCYTFAINIYTLHTAVLELLEKRPLVAEQISLTYTIP